MGFTQRLRPYASGAVRFVPLPKAFALDVSVYRRVRDPGFLEGVA